MVGWGLKAKCRSLCAFSPAGPPPPPLSEPLPGLGSRHEDLAYTSSSTPQFSELCYSGKWMGFS